MPDPKYDTVLRTIDELDEETEADVATANETTAASEPANQVEQ